MSRLIDEIRAMSPEERQELAAVLEDLEPKPEPEAIQLGKPFDLRPKDDRGVLLSPEAAWDRDHSLGHFLRIYGYYETNDCRFFGGKLTVKKFTKKEIDEYNAEQLQIWLKAKREVFPDCLEPEFNPETGAVKYLYR